ncbi:hypothetical protein P879_09698 [Paragonimus westermani]|uniref:Peptidase A2 domain-containing protein n=1 Tax=Paragonimus westermani TaxID=34504 RepID=A0A8T0DEG2_9TREM|nr:hypothetical protein P879_09698 [Paragonimus westermani]
MAVEPQTTPISLGKRACVHHWDSPQWDRGVQRSSGTHQRSRGTGLPGDRRGVRPPWKRQPQSGCQRNCTEQTNGECSNACGFCVPSVNASRIEPVPRTNVRLKSGVVSALLDTDASCSLLRPEFTQGFHRRHDNRRLKAANGTALRSLGVTRVPVVIDGFSVVHDFVVSGEIPWEAIIECDFLKRINRTVDFNRQLFRCSNSELPLTVETQNETDWDAGLVDVLPEDLDFQIDNLLSASEQPTTANGHSQLHSTASTTSSSAVPRNAREYD